MEGKKLPIYNEAEDPCFGKEKEFFIYEVDAKRNVIANRAQLTFIACHYIEHYFQPRDILERLYEIANDRRQLWEEKMRRQIGEKKKQDQRAFLKFLEQMSALRGINLGKVWNKNLIIDIFFSSGEENPQREAEIVLWLCSWRHRIFLPKNFAWYPKNLTPPVWFSLKSQSGQLETLQQVQFLFKHIRIEGTREATQVTCIYTASIDGWNPEDFHRLCDGKGPTLCLIRSSENVLAVGFTSIPWTSHYTSVEDASACLFALTGTLQVFKTKNPEKAVFHSSVRGP